MKVKCRQPLIITKIEFLSLADDVSKRKIQQVMELLLRNSGNGEPRSERFEELNPLVLITPNGVNLDSEESPLLLITIGGILKGVSGEIELKNPF